MVELPELGGSAPLESFRLGYYHQVRSEVGGGIVVELYLLSSGATGVTQPCGRSCREVPTLPGKFPCGTSVKLLLSKAAINYCNCYITSVVLDFGSGLLSPLIRVTLRTTVSHRFERNHRGT